MKRIMYYLLRTVLITLVVFLVLGGIYNSKKSNIHVVQPHQYIRSAQLNSNALIKLIQEDQVKSIINLRGTFPDDPWYQAEIQAANQYGVEHEDLPMNAYIYPKSETLRSLVQLLQNAPQPALIHCEGGADRTGLASAIVMLLQNGSYAQAAQQVSIKYFAYSSRSVGRLVLPLYEEWLTKNGLVSSTQNFLKWEKQVYFPPVQLTEESGWVDKVMNIIFNKIDLVFTSICHFFKEDPVKIIYPYQYYGTAKLDMKTLNQIVDSNGVQSFLNLGGFKPEETWYTNAVLIANQNGLDYKDLEFELGALPSPQELRALAVALQSVRLPVLVYCNRDPDRVGLAAAIIVLLHEGTLKQALQQVSNRFFIYSNRNVTHRVLQLYQNWLSKNNLSSSSTNFMKWVAQYDGEILK